jgi:hypothetical protein
VSRLSVFTFLLRVAYIGAKFGSAAMTPWPSPSRCCATHSLSADASTRMRAAAQPASKSSKLALVDLMRRSVSSPPSERMQIWLEVLCRSMPTKSMAGLLCAVSTTCSKSRALCRNAASRFIPFNYVKVAGRTPDLTGREAFNQASELAMRNRLIPLRLNELSGGVPMA